MSEFYGRIRRGAVLMHDFRFGRWPACNAPGGEDEASNPDMVFRVETINSKAKCVAFGFGMLRVPDRGYGCSAIHVGESDVLKPHIYQKGGIWYLAWPGEEPECSGISPKIVYQVWKWTQDGKVAEAQ